MSTLKQIRNSSKFDGVHAVEDIQPEGLGWHSWIVEAVASKKNDLTREDITAKIEAMFAGTAGLALTLEEASVGVGKTKEQALAAFELADNPENSEDTGWD